MSDTDIHGVVEAYDGDTWFPIMNVRPLLSRNYGVFGSLFGICNYDAFEPIAYGKGLPEDVSYFTKNSWNSSTMFHSPTFITYEEIREIDWKEKAKMSSALRQRCDSCGTLETTTTDMSVFNTEEIQKICSGENVKKDDVTYSGIIPTRGERLTKDWKDLFAIMRCLSDRYGDNKVRLVVWFES